MSKKYIQGFLAASAVFWFSSLINNSDVFAHTATISTSGTVNIDVLVAVEQANIATDDVVVNSTCPLGYTLSIAGPADNALYKDGDSSNNADNQKIVASSGTISVPVSILGDNLGTWGFTVSQEATINSSFIGLTNTATPFITKNTASGDGSGSTATGTDTIPVHYGVSVGTDKEAGLYKLAESAEGAGDNVITYYLTTNPNCNSYVIKYNDNGANSSTAMTGMTRNVTEGTTETVNLAPSNYQRAGYGFAGWSTEQLDPDAANFQTKLTAAKNAGHVFGPMETITVNSELLNQATFSDNQQVITMYAIWVKSAGNLQAWTGCSSMSQGQVTALKDTRDNQVYAIAKLADGKCWMIENLRLNDAATLTAQNTNNPALPLTNTWYYDADNQTTATTSNHLSASVTPSSTAWCKDGDANCFHQSMLYTGNTTDAVADMATMSGANIYSYGNLYNYYSAAAGNYNDVTGVNEIVGDICPMGWRLPTGYNDGEFFALNTLANAGSTNTSLGLRSYPNNFVYSGNVLGASINNTGSSGYYWSSTANGRGNAYRMAVGKDDVRPGTTSGYDYGGHVVRCVAKSKHAVTVNIDSGVSKVKFYNAGTGTQEVTTNGGTVTLYEKTSYTITTELVDHYEFATWAAATNGVVADASSNPTTYNVSGTTALSVTTRLPITLEYAYERAGKTKYNGYYKLQDMSASICNDANILDEGSQMQAIDVRDNKKYWITKLQDGKCWMTQNLDLNLDKNTTYTHANTDIGWGSDTTSSVAVNGFKPVRSTVTDVDDWEDDYNTPYSVDTGNYFANNEWYESTQCKYTSGCTGTNPVKFQANTPFASNGTHGAVGNHYNWAAATASNDISGYTENSYTDISKNAQNSICPAGWRLPTISNQGNGLNSTSEFARLAKLYGDTTANDKALMAAPLYFTRTGNYMLMLGGNGLINSGNNGMYWSSTGDGSTNSYELSMYSSSINPTDYAERAFGLTIRCVAR